MLFGRYASRAAEARYPQLWAGRVFAACPSVQGPAGLNVYDLSGRGQHGLASGVTLSTFWERSAGRYATVFDGSNDYLSSPNVTTFASGSQVTASIWVKRAATGATHCLLAKWLSTASSNEDGWIVRWFNTNTIWWSVAESGSYGHLISSSAYTSLDWNHICAVHEFGTTAKTALYLNGAQISASWTGGGTQVPDSDATSAPITAGALRYQGGPLQWFNGSVDDWAVYNRILSPGEIRLLATRRGIAYEARRDVFGQDTGARRRRILCGDYS